jgi:hypothetical protein
MTVFLSLAMLALIAMQAYWIKHSIQSEENLLGLTVNQVLSDVSDELVKNETVINILDEIHPPIVQHQSSAVWNYHIDARSALSADTDQLKQMDEQSYVYSSSPAPLKNQ